VKIWWTFTLTAWAVKEFCVWKGLASGFCGLTFLNIFRWKLCKNQSILHVAYFSMMINEQVFSHRKGNVVQCISKLIFIGNQCRAFCEHRQVCNLKLSFHRFRISWLMMRRVTVRVIDFLLNKFADWFDCLTFAHTAYLNTDMCKFQLSENILMKIPVRWFSESFQET